MGNLFYFVLSVFVCFCSWYGVFYQIPGLINIALFYAWMCFVLSLCYLNNDIVKILRDKRNLTSKIYRVSSKILDVIILVPLVYNGNYATCAFFAFGILLIKSVESKAFND